MGGIRHHSRCQITTCNVQVMASLADCHKFHILTREPTEGIAEIENYTLHFSVPPVVIALTGRRLCRSVAGVGRLSSNDQPSIALGRKASYKCAPTRVLLQDDRL